MSTHTKKYNTIQEHAQEVGPNHGYTNVEKAVVNIVKEH